MMIDMNVLDARSVIDTAGLVGVLGIVFAETGLLAGFVLPGDTVLFLAGVASSAASKAVFGFRLWLPGLLLGAPVCAIGGAQVGYALGVRVGPRLVERPRSRWLTPARVARARQFLARFGHGKAIVMARFVPVVRTVLNPVVGALGVPRRRFLLWNVVGGLVWADGVSGLGYLFGETVRGDVDRHLFAALTIWTVVSLLPIAFELLRTRRRPPRDDASEPDTGH
jgi:membrane-associated protein